MLAAMEFIPCKECFANKPAGKVKLGGERCKLSRKGNVVFQCCERVSSTSVMWFTVTRAFARDRAEEPW